MTEFRAGKIDLYFHVQKEVLTNTLFSVHQCLFCPQTFDSATEKDDHILEHFAQVTCTECNQNLIRIGEYLYIRHDEVTCIKKISAPENPENCVRIQNCVRTLDPIQ